MVFASNVFLFCFLPLTLAAYLLTPGLRGRNLILLCASLLFYAWGEGALVLLMVGSIGFNFTLGRLIGARRRSMGGAPGKGLLTFGVGANLAALAYFKYFDFFTSSAVRLLESLGFVDAHDPRFQATLAEVERDLKRGPYLYRYAIPDDFGVPEVAFNVCTFWYVDALAASGRDEEARELFENMLSRCNTVGLLSEDLDVESGELWGNFPQTYSMVGLINSAMRLSKSWEEAF